MTADRLPRNVRILSWVSFFQDVASEMLYPVIPVFLTGTLGASTAVVGAIEGLAEALSSLLKTVSGVLADRAARRPLVAAGYGLSSVAKGLLSIATGWWFALVCRALDRIGKGLRTSPRDALIAGDTPEAIRGRAFGFHRAIDTAGAVVGPLLGVALLRALHADLRPLFAVAVIPALCSVALIGFVRETPVKRKPEPWNGGALGSAYWRAIVLTTLFGLVNFPDALIILKLRQLGMALVPIMLSYTLYNVCYAALSYPAGRISDRVPRHLVYAAGLGVFAIAYAGIGLSRTSAAAVAFLVFYGAYTALTDGVGKAWVASFLPPRSMGRGLGFHHTAIGLASLFAGIWAGMAWGDGVRPFLISAVAAAALCATIAMAGGERRLRHLSR